MYISQKDTNKLIRAALKESFPSVKFSVRGKSYSGGGSTTISWTDGPNVKQVERVISVFEGSYFDGMIDYKGSRYATLDGENVHFMTDFIFCNREHSEKAEIAAVRRLANKYGNQCEHLQSPPEAILQQQRAGELNSVFPCGGDWSMENSLSVMIREQCAKHTSTPFPQTSKTLARVAFRGDDGYGAGTVGPDGKGSGYAGYPRLA